MQDGIKRTVRIFLLLAKSAQHDVLKYKRRYNAGENCAHASYYRAVSDRANWLWAARQVLLQTTDGVVSTTCSDRRDNRRRAERLAQTEQTEQAV